MTNLEKRVEFPDESGDSRAACVLLLDVSISMEGAPIQALNEGLVAFKDSCAEDDLASRRIEVAVLSFAGEPTIVTEFTQVRDFIPPRLSTKSGGTAMAKAILAAIDLVDARKVVYRSNGLEYYRPMIFLITDGFPTDDAELISEASDAIRDAGRQFTFFAVGVEDADLEFLTKLGHKEAKKLRGLEFTKLFEWLSKSLVARSHSGIAEMVPMPPRDEWEVWQ
jgi:uncharacterized protein YegL